MGRRSKFYLARVACAKRATEGWKRNCINRKLASSLVNCDDRGQPELGTVDEDVDCAIMETEDLAEGGQSRAPSPPPPRRTCFVCCAHLTSKVTKSNPLPPPELFSFLLQHMLELPVLQAMTYLAGLEKPESWIRLCPPCHQLIVKGRELREELDKLQSQFRQCKQKILGSMKGTIDIPRAPATSIRMDNPSQDLTERRALLQIQDFVKGRQYAVLNPASRIHRNQVKYKASRAGGPLKKKKVISAEEGQGPPPVPVPELEGNGTENENMIDLNQYLPASPGGDSDQGQDQGQDLVQDPLATDCETSPIKVEDDGDPDPAHRMNQNQLYCGLCEDSETYENEADLISHTQTCHQLPSSSTTSTRGEPSSWDLRPSSSSAYACYEYDCPHCPKVKKYSVIRYAQHLGIHFRRPYQCVKCLESFPDADLQENHWKEKHQAIDEGPNPSETITDKFIKIKFDPGKMWKCDNCLEGFFTEAERTSHELRCTATTQPRAKRTPTRSHPCQLCPTTILRNFPEWRLHRAIHHPEVDKMSCYYCDKSFCEKTVEGVEVRHDMKLQEHMVSQHTGDEFGVIKIHLECPPCGLVFNSETLHNEHGLRIHGTKSCHHCEICTCSYSLAKVLRRHVTVAHFQSEASICDICGQNFTKRIGVAHHKLVEHGIEPSPEEGFKVLACPHQGCDYKAVQQYCLSSHVKSRHTEKTRPYTCRFCAKTFIAQSHLREHEEIHKNKESKPYQCDICGNSFAVRNYLYIHKRLSHEKRTFPSTNRKRKPKTRTDIGNSIGGNVEGPVAMETETQDNSGEMGDIPSSTGLDFI